MNNIPNDVAELRRLLAKYEELLKEYNDVRSALFNTAIAHLPALLDTIEQQSSDIATIHKLRCRGDHGNSKTNAACVISSLIETPEI